MYVQVKKLINVLNRIVISPERPNKKTKMKTKMETKMKQMPTDVVNKIFSYYYSPQPPALMEDIRNYTQTINKIQQMYTKEWAHNPTEVKDWIINDIWAWANQNQATMHGLVEKFYSIWERMEYWWFYKMLPPGGIAAAFVVNPNVRQTCVESRIDSYLSRYLSHKPTAIQIRIFWAALNATERLEFINEKLTLFENT